MRPSRCDDLQSCSNGSEHSTTVWSNGLSFGSRSWKSMCCLVEIITEPIGSRWLDYGQMEWFSVG